METASVALQVVIGGNNHIYRKVVSMPILPVGSVVRFGREQEWYIRGYWWEGGLTIAWLSHWKHLNDELKRNTKHGDRASLLCSYAFERLPKEYKDTFVKLGFEWTKARIETV
jgi:hypothetical protein